MSSTSNGPGVATALPHRPIPLETRIVGAALAAAVVLAWVWLLRSRTGGMAMHPDPLSAAYLASAFVMWAVMMIAMMVPSASPMVLLHARIGRAPTARARFAHTLMFALGYILLWTAFSAAAAAAQALLVASGAVSAAALSVGSRGLASTLLLGAAVYELTAAKRLCLDKCQSPFLFIARYFRPGAAGAFRLGIVHGLFCLGCCWALMLLLFVGGVMNLAWVALLGVLIVGQKLAAPEWQLNRVVAAGLVAGAAALLLTR